MSNTLTMVPAKSITDSDLEELRKALANMSKDSPLAVAIRQFLLSQDSSITVSSKDLTPAQVARLLKVSRPYVYKLMDQNLLNFHYVGSNRRISQDDLWDYVNRGEQGRSEYASALSNRTEDLRKIDQDAASYTEADRKELAELFS
ncbi:hypothetical protein KIMH_01890 [Bombiscardovia apis]|uniref:Helix-turn-helix domain-containing protein n=1 Tax=Bombiscardovia apis TaxID=2932182 RepID=A0ABN6SFQ7_9BIFI|nr:helix-turn-helix domain-containing protein [Bombiscardovia apis]BDR54078.1 hypothetical protein KIMH_01890 [Bombiscardovia apis]